MSLVARSPYPSSSSFDTSLPGRSSLSMEHAQQHQAAFLARQHPNHPQPGSFPGQPISLQQQQQQQQQQQMQGGQQQQQPRPMVRRTASQQQMGPGQLPPGAYVQPNGQMMVQRQPAQYAQHAQYSPHQQQQQQMMAQRDGVAYVRQQGQPGPSMTNGQHVAQQHQLPLHPSAQPQHSTPYQNHPQAFQPGPAPPTPSQQHLAHLSQASHRPESTPPQPNQAYPPPGGTPQQHPPPPAMHPHPRQASLSPPNQFGPGNGAGGPQHVPQHHQQPLPPQLFNKQQQQQQQSQNGSGGVGPAPGPPGQQQMYARQRGMSGPGGPYSAGGPQQQQQQRMVPGNQMMMQPRVQGLGISGSKSEPPHGAAILRLLQYFAGFSDGERRSELGYWRDLVETYFSEHGFLSLDLKSTSKGDTKHFDIPTSVLPRYFLVGYETGLKSITLNLENPRESRTAVSNLGVRSITVDVTRASMTHTFANGCQVVTMGTLKCSLVVTNEGGEVSPLLIDRIHYEAHSHTEYVARLAMVPQLVSQGQKDLLSGAMGAGAERNGTPMAQAPTPTMTPKTSGEVVTATGKKGAGAKGGAAKGKGKESSGEGKSGTEEAEEETGTTTTDDSSSLLGGGTMTAATDASALAEVYSLPTSSVNDFGISPGMMRCLELAQGVATMAPLFAFCQSSNLGPKEGLRRYADTLRAQLQHSSSASTSSQSSSSPPQPPTPLGGGPNQQQISQPPNQQPPQQQQQQQQQATFALNPPPPTNAPTPAGGQAVTPSPMKQDEAPTPVAGSLKRKKQPSTASTQEDAGDGGDGGEEDEKPAKNARPTRNRASSRRSSRGGPGSGTG